MKIIMSKSYTEAFGIPNQENSSAKNKEKAKERENPIRVHLSRVFFKGLSNLGSSYGSDFVYKFLEFIIKYYSEILEIKHYTELPQVKTPFVILGSGKKRYHLIELIPSTGIILQSRKGDLITMRRHLTNTQTENIVVLAEDPQGFFTLEESAHLTSLFKNIKSRMLIAEEEYNLRHDREYFPSEMEYRATLMTDKMISR